MMPRSRIEVKMALEVYAFTCGWLTLPLGLLLEGEKGSLKVPVPSYLIRHPKGTALFDTGLHLETQTRPDEWLGRLAAIHTVQFKAGEEIRSRLAALNVGVDKIDFIVNSHLHFDHCGGLVRRRESGVLEAAFPKARLFVQRGELDTARDPKNERLHAAYRHMQDVLGPNASKFEAIEGVVEVIAGVTAALTGGHTYDHQVVVVRDGSEGFAHLADIVPTRSHMRGPWNQAYDLDALRTMDEKARYLREAAENGYWLSFAHDDSVYAARIKSDRGKFVIDRAVPVDPDFSKRT